MALEKGVSCVLLAYKEAENLKLLIPQIQRQLNTIKESFEIIVVDTAQSLDDTPEVCLNFGVRYVNQEWPCFGGAFRTGIKYAKYDKFLILDSDGSHNPKYIPAIYEKFVKENADVVIGSRYVKGGVTNDSKSSIVMSHILNTAFRVCLAINAKDISTDYRMYHTSDLKEVELTNQNYDILQEVLLKISLKKPDKKLDIKEVPITFEKRIFGESKRKLIPFIIDYMRSLVKLTLMRFPTLYNLVLYVGFGALAAVLEYVLFYVCVINGIVKQSEIANLIGATAGFLFTFLTNTFLNFRKSDKLGKRFVSYFLIVLLGMGISTGAIALLKNTVNIYVLKAVLQIGVSLLQFYLNKKFTYRDKNIENLNVQ